MASIRSERGKIVLSARGFLKAPSQHRTPPVWHPYAPPKTWAGPSFAAARMARADMLYDRYPGSWLRAGVRRLRQRQHFGPTLHPLVLLVRFLVPWENP